MLLSTGIWTVAGVSGAFLFHSVSERTQARLTAFTALAAMVVHVAVRPVILAAISCLMKSTNTPRLQDMCPAPCSPGGTGGIERNNCRLQMVGVGSQAAFLAALLAILGGVGAQQYTQ